MLIHLNAERYVATLFAKAQIRSWGAMVSSRRTPDGVDITAERLMELSPSPARYIVPVEI